MDELAKTLAIKASKALNDSLVKDLGTTGGVKKLVDDALSGDRTALLLIGAVVFGSLLAEDKESDK